MGVVFLAHDLKLPRLVALKMIRAGSDADEKEKRRFHAEAAAVLGELGQEGFSGAGATYM